MKDKAYFRKLERFAADIRIETIKMFAEAGYGHIGGSMSIADVLGVLYGGIMEVDPENPLWEKRDRLVLSKGIWVPPFTAVVTPASPPMIFTLAPE